MAKILEPFTERDDSDQIAGYLVWCPGCQMLHSLYVIPGNHPHWQFNGNLDAPTFSPSLLVRYPYGDPSVDCRCHSFIRDGQWEFLTDSTHDLAGETVPMVPIPD